MHSCMHACISVGMTIDACSFATMGSNKLQQRSNQTQTKKWTLTMTHTQTKKCTLTMTHTQTKKCTLNYDSDSDKEMHSNYDL